MKVRTISTGQRQVGNEQAVKIVQALQVLFGEEKVMRFTAVEMMCINSAGGSPMPLGVILNGLLRSEFREAVLKAAAGG